MSKQPIDPEIVQISYVAFLRGINNIGRKTIKMNELKHHFEALGYQQVKTVMASGNVLFKINRPLTTGLSSEIEKQLEKKLGYRVDVILRSLDDLHLLVKSNLFGQIKLKPQTKLLLTFLPGKTTSRLKIPYKSSEKDFTIVRITNTEIYSVVYLLPNLRPYRIIPFLEKEFGKNITTRNWNTILKVVNA